MAKFQVTAPDGAVYEVDGPEGSTQDDAIRYVQQNIDSLSAKSGAKPKQEPTGNLSAFAEGVGQGLTFGFSDEIEAGARGALDFVTGGPGYSERLKAARARQKQAADTNPLAYYGGEIGSAIAVPFGAARLAGRAAAAAPGLATRAAEFATVRGVPVGFGATSRSANMGLGARTAASASEGAAYGAAYGFGQGEGGFGDRAVNAAETGTVGGIFGGVAPAAIDAGAAAIRPLRDAVRGYTNPQGVAAERFAQAMAGDMVGSSQTANDLAEFTTRAGARARMLASDPTAMQADIGGEQTRRLIRQANDMPNDNVSRFNRRLDQRQNNQWRRIERGFGQALGNADEYATTVGDTVTRRGQQAADDFSAAFSVETPMTPELAAVLDRPAMRGLLERVQNNLLNEGAAVGLENRTQALHRLKLELDEQIGQARRARATGNSPTSGYDLRTLMTLKNDLLSTMDNPMYRQALNNFAGESALINAAEEGFENALRMPVEEISPLMRGMTEGEREMWQLGAARALAQKVRAGNVTRDRTENLFSSPDIQMRLRAMFNVQDVPRTRSGAPARPMTQAERDNLRQLRVFQRLLIQEARKADVRKATQGGSRTSQNLATSDQQRSPMTAIADTAQALTSGRMDGLLRWLGNISNRFSGLTPRTAEHILEMAMRAPGDAPTELIPLLQEAARSPEIRARIVRRLIAGSAPVAAASSE